MTRLACVRGLISGLVVAVLAGCAPQLPPLGATDAARARLVALDHWRMEGRIGVQTAADGFQANLRWEHEKAQDRVQVSGPFNQGAVSIVLQDDFILIRDGRGEVRTSRDAAGLLRKELGFPVPLANLRYWVIGVPEPGRTGVPTYDAAGLLRELTQDGWSLAYEQFVPVKDLVLPQRLSARGNDMKLKLVVDDWELLR